VDDREEKLIEQYEAVGHLDGRTLLLRHADALRFIDDCERVGLVILGMDFFDLQPGAIIPLGIADYSSVSNQPDAPAVTAAAARALIADGFPDSATWVEFVLG
jgi:hypothetical protein